MRTDRKTVAYFDEHLPEYHVERLHHAAEAIRRYGRPEASLVDVGCGTGGALKFLAERTGIRPACGIDVSARSLERARAAAGCEVLQGSVLDPALPEVVGRRFDFVVMSAVLHHLIGRTRSESRRLASEAVANALRLLHPGGFLIVFEPVYRPRLAMDVLFYVKKVVSAFRRGRVPVLGEWYNIGPPVVSFYTAGEVRELVLGAGTVQIVEAHEVDEVLDRALPRLVLRKHDLTIVAQPRDPGSSG